MKWSHSWGEAGQLCLAWPQDLASPSGHTLLSRGQLGEGRGAGWTCMGMSVSGWTA